MPTSRELDGAHALSNAERQARYRARREAQRPPPKVRYRWPTDRRSRAQRWDDTVAGLVDLQAEYIAWHDALPDSLRDSATARRFRPLLISTSTRSSQSCHRAATGATEPVSNQGTHGGAAALPAGTEKLKKAQEMT